MSKLWSAENMSRAKKKLLHTCRQRHKEQTQENRDSLVGNVM